MYKEYKQLNLSQTGKEILEYWKENRIFEKSISNRPSSKPYTFYEGPPSANGMPGIHHVMSRAIKDIFCRYKTLKGYQVNRKGGWDTHGLPIELAVEKTLGITKDDIGKKISIEDYNAECRREVMKYTDVWNDLTEKMGYWVDLDHPYITYENKYIETLWWILKEFYKKDLLYKGYTVQPFSPAAGTGLSSHELNQPGTYRNVKDTSVVAEFRVKKDQVHPLIHVLFEEETEDTAILAWTTTPWTLPSNCALAIGEKITYVKVKTINQYTFAPVSVVLAKELLLKHFKPEGQNASFSDYKNNDKVIPWEIAAEFKGKDLLNLRYQQLLPYVSNENLQTNAFRVIAGDFVTTEDGTGIVHIASVFGADDFRAARENGVPSVMITDDKGNELPLVDRHGMFVDEVTDFAGRYVKEEYYSDEERKKPDFKPTDVLIAIKLKEDNKAFDVKKYEHSYPHCWRTDKPVLYYPLDSWFIKTTAVKDRLVELNKTINWKPEATGTGRFGNWLENLVDWNLSRSRFWGTPLPIWRTEDGSEEICIGSISELELEIDKAIKAGFMAQGSAIEDLHRPYVDDVILVSKNGNRMFREPDLIDVWFDSGAMPYAQWGLPPTPSERGGDITPKEFLKYWNAHAYGKVSPTGGPARQKHEANALAGGDLEGAGAIYPADFIAEGVDQTRGWFFTLHAISVMLNDSIAFKNVISNGLVLDKEGNKMSKRLGNAADPFETIEKYSADATRWYMISNASPWDNLKFNTDGPDEVRRKFFGTLYNTYSFFTLYANIDKFSYKEEDIAYENRPEIDRWVLSLLNSLTREVDRFYEDFEPTKATRLIQDFVDQHLSNWYVRLSRRRFWKPARQQQGPNAQAGGGDYMEDKISAYQTLYTCLNTIAKLMSPVAPFFSDRLFLDLNTVTKKEQAESVHLTDFPDYNKNVEDKALEERMALAQDISSLILSLRKKTGINVRQPLNKALLPVLDKHFMQQVEKVKDLILSETNIKSIEYINDTSGIIKKKIKPNFKALGQKVGKDMKAVSDALMSLSQAEISKLENEGQFELTLYNDGLNTLYAIRNTQYVILNTEVEIIAEDIPGWQVASLGKLTVALDVTITPGLKQEGIARELVNRIQNMRKDLGFEVTDKIRVRSGIIPYLTEAINNNMSYICGEILAVSFEFDGEVLDGEVVDIDNHELKISIIKV